MTERQLSELLHEVVPAPPEAIDPDVVLRNARRRRRAGAGAVALVAAVGVVGAAVGVPRLVGQTGGPEVPTVRVSPTAEAPLGRTATFHGVTLPVPHGWKVAKPPRCGNLPKAKTVVVGDSTWDGRGGCPITADDPLQVTVWLESMYGGSMPVEGPSRGAVGTTRNGQPAWTSDLPDFYGGHLAVLTLPWSNVAVLATGPDKATARRLLSRVVVPPPGDWQVPGSARHVLLGSQADAASESKQIDDPVVVRRLLGELRNLSPVTAVSASCIDPATWKKPVLLTLDSGSGDTQAFLLRGDSCRVVTGPAGGAARVTGALWADVNALLAQ